jgi:hypothetical protein
MPRLDLGISQRKLMGVIQPEVRVPSVQFLKGDTKISLGVTGRGKETPKSSAYET